MFIAMKYLNNINFSLLINCILILMEYAIQFSRSWNTFTFVYFTQYLLALYFLSAYRSNCQLTEFATPLFVLRIAANYLHNQIINCCATRKFTRLSRTHKVLHHPTRMYSSPPHLIQYSLLIVFCI